MKKKNLLIAFTIFMGLFGIESAMALDHGSMTGKGLPMYPIRDGKAPGTVVDGITFDYRVVTVGNKTWAWTDWHGKNISGNDWSSQFRYWQPGVLENQLKGRIAGTQQTYGTAGLPATNPVTVTFLQEEANAFFETADITYDYTKSNSADAGDKTAPVLAEPTIVSKTDLSIEMTLSATDDSNEFFYCIIDEANNFAEVSFFNNVTLNFQAGIAYTFSIYAIDFSGNLSNVKTVTTEAGEPAYFVEGVAKDLTFKLDSRSMSELLIECTSHNAIGDAFVKLSINGNPVKDAQDPSKDAEWKATLDQNIGSTTYLIHVPAADIPGWAQDAVLELNLGYITAPVGNWGHYVLTNNTITDGQYKGYPILHKIGEGVDIEEPEPEPDMKCENNLFEGSIFTNDGINGGGENGHDVYFAPGWNQNPNYTVAVTAGNEVNISLQDATYEAWQAQFRLRVNTPVPVTPGTEYGFSVNVTSSTQTPFYVKYFDNDDRNFFMEIDRTTASVGTSTMKKYKFICPEGLTQISYILFDFGGNPANTNLTISDIVMCDQMRLVGVDGYNVDNISISQEKGIITINSENNIKSASIYNINGQILPVSREGNLIKTNELQSGIYILKIYDAADNQKSFKIMIK